MHPYDAVLAFGLYPNTLAWAAVKGMRRRPALILTEITRPDTEARLTGRVRHAVSHVVRRVSYPGADLCGANSEDGVAEVVRCYSVDPRRIRRLPNLVEPDRLACLSAEDADGVDAADLTPSICAVSRLDPLKRIDTLLEAAALLPPGLAWRVDILGDGPERRALEALAARLGIGSRVRFHGWTRNPYPTMRRALATVLSSSYEGFSNTVLESLALGTPVITSYCSSDARQMTQVGAALGFSIGDHRALAERLLRVLREPGLCRELSAKGRIYTKRHTLPGAVREYEALVRDAVALRA
jgi:glycosyltransferase involved in cell wall biosynthesis